MFCVLPFVNIGLIVLKPSAHVLTVLTLLPDGLMQTRMWKVFKLVFFHVLIALLGGFT